MMKFFGRSLSTALCCSVVLASAALANFGLQPGSGIPSAKNMIRGLLRPFPQQYVFVNPGLSAPAGGYSNAAPNQMIEFLYSPSGVDPFITNANGYPQFYNTSVLKGLTPSEAFQTPQGCSDYVSQTFYYNGVQPVCRGMNPGANSAGTAYTGALQITGGPVGTQIRGGGQILFTGTCSIPNSMWNDMVGQSTPGGTATDVILQTNPAVPGTLVSAINAAYLVLSCLTLSADVYSIDVQQQSNVFINGGVRIIQGPGGSVDDILVAQNSGQIYIDGLTVATGASGAVALGEQNSNMFFFGGQTATFSASMSANSMSVLESSISGCSASPPGLCIGVGQVIAGAGVIQGTYVTAYLGCSAGTCGYIISNSQTIGSAETMTSWAPAVTFVNQSNTGQLPLYAQTFAGLINAAFTIPSANVFAGQTNAGSGPKCSIIVNSSMFANGTSGNLPGGTGSPCAASLGGIVD